jgi:thiosulfate/3-mercaptopyruvate sulfurtransferase
MPHTTLISTEALAEVLGAGAGATTSALAIVDCRYDLTNEGWGLERYRAGHIPGASYASLSDDLAGARTGGNGRHPLPPIDAMVATFAGLGIGPETQVVAYDQDSGMFASRLWWMLRYLGHEAAAVLDGGWAQWTREARPVRSGSETRPPARFSGMVRDALRVDVTQVERAARDRSALLMDARSAERFEGRSEPIDRVAGHIPGAVNRPHRDNVSDAGAFLPPETLKAQFDDLLRGREPGEVVLYCGSGVTACHNLLAMDVAGLPGARLYPGSWSEWSSDERRPVETGPARRD